MTSTICVLPIIAALSMANNFEDIKNVNWNPVNQEQKIFVENHWPNLADLDLLKDGEMRSKASRNVNLVNQFLNDNDFKIQLTDLHNPFAVYIASILNVALEWENEGTKTTLKVEGKEYPAVSMEHGNFKVYSIRYAQKGVCYFTGIPPLIEVIEIDAKNGDKVFMTLNHEFTSSLSGFELLEQAENWSHYIHEGLEGKFNKSRYTPFNTPFSVRSYDEAIFPMIDIDQEVDISWLKNLSGTEGNKGYEVAQALQQTKFQMNEKGAKVKSAAAMSIIEKCCFEPKPKKVFRISDSFYLWIIRPGMKTPIFAAYIDTDAWKSPTV